MPALESGWIPALERAPPQYEVGRGNRIAVIHSDPNWKNAQQGC